MCLLFVEVIVDLIGLVGQLELVKPVAEPVVELQLVVFGDYQNLLTG